MDIESRWCDCCGKHAILTFDAKGRKRPCVVEWYNSDISDEIALCKPCRTTLENQGISLELITED